MGPNDEILFGGGTDNKVNVQQQPDFFSPCHFKKPLQQKLSLCTGEKTSAVQVHLLFGLNSLISSAGRPGSDSGLLL